MKTAILALLALGAFSTAAFAQQNAPTSLPNVTWDCYQAFSSVTGLPDSPIQDVGVDGDNFDEPHVRYRLQVVGGKVLKIIVDPNRPSQRTESGTPITRMTRDYMNKHKIVAWRETSSGEASLYTLDFDNRLFSILKMTQTKTFNMAKITVTKCK